MKSAAPHRPFFTPLFVACAVVLVVTSIGLRPAISALTRYYTKEPIAVVRPLEEFDDARLPSFERAEHEEWMRVSEDVGTEDVLMRPYRPRAAVPGLDARSTFLLFATYYSDPRAQVAHTPEVCYRQAGSEVRSVRIIPLDVPGIDPSAIEARLVALDNPEGRSYIVYVFCAHGVVYHDRESVRWAIGMPGDKYTYYSKIEAIGYPLGEDDDVVMAVTADLLREALPVLLNEHFPSREALRRR